MIRTWILVAAVFTSRGEALVTSAASGYRSEEACILEGAKLEMIMHDKFPEIDRSTFLFRCVIDSKDAK